jgi:hypothetical protein
VAVITQLFQLVFGQVAAVAAQAELELCFHHQVQTLVVPAALVYILVSVDQVLLMQVVVVVDHMAQAQLPQVV